MLSELKFTKQDVLTFVIGAVAGVAWVVGDALIDSTSLFDDTGKWFTALGIGITAALGRWIVTYLALKGFSR